MKRERYMPHGELALDPKAFGMPFDCHDEPPHPEARGEVVVVPIVGPLVNQGSFWWDSYKAIRSRVADVLASSPRAVILDIDSPGGEVSGCFDTARELRRLAADARVPLLAHVSGHATSAAYALATAASRIGVSRTATLGSIGVMASMVDATAMNEQRGLRVAVITSGALKADGNPDTELDAEAVARMQRKVNRLAEEFFALVVEHGRGESADTIRSLEAGQFLGPEAVALGLADEITTLEKMLADPAAFGEAVDPTPTGGPTMADEDKNDDEMKTARAALEKAAESDDEETAKKAKAALKAMDDDEPDAQGDEDPPKSEDKDDGPSGEGEDDDEKAKASAKASGVDREYSVHKRLHALETKIAADEQAAERDKLIASRPDFSAQTVAFLKDCDLATVRRAVKDFEKGPGRKEKLAAHAAAAGGHATPTRGKGQGDRTPQQAPSAAAEMARRMGLVKTETVVVKTPHRMTFGVQKPVTTTGDDR